MRKGLVSAVSMLLSAAMVLGGCSSSNSGNKGGEAQPAQPASSPAPAQQEVKKEEPKKTTKLKVGYLMAEGSPSDQAANKFKELVAKGTDGQVEVELFPNSQLGGERDMLEGMKIGTVDVVITGDAVFPMFAPEYAGFSMPYVMRDVDHMLRVLNGPVGEEVNEVLRKSLNSVVLDWWIRGPRNLTAKKEIKTPDDITGMKLRVPEVPLSVESWKALGANPTPMAFPELFVGMQQGVVDGQENPLDLIYTSKFYEVQTHVMLTEHLIAPFVFLMNEKKLGSLPADIQQKIKDAVKEAGKFEIALAKELEDDFKKKLADTGMKVVEVDKEVWRKKLEAANVNSKFEDKWAPNLLQRIRDTK